MFSLSFLQYRVSEDIPYSDVTNPYSLHPIYYMWDIPFFLNSFNTS